MPRKMKEDTDKDVLAKFMSFRDGQNYASNAVFTQEQLIAITALELKRWMQLKAYGTPDPDDDANQTQGRSSSLEFYKKAISFFIPRRLSPWDPITNKGNWLQIFFHELASIIHSPHHCKLKFRSSWNHIFSFNIIKGVENNEHVLKLFFLH